MRGAIRHQRLAHRGEPLVLGIGEPQPLAQPLGVLDDRNAERAEPPHRIGRQRRPRASTLAMFAKPASSGTPPSTVTQQARIPP